MRRDTRRHATVRNPSLQLAPCLVQWRFGRTRPLAVCPASSTWSTPPTSGSPTGSAARRSQLRLRRHAITRETGSLRSGTEFVESAACTAKGLQQAEDALGCDRHLSCRRRIVERRRPQRRGAIANRSRGLEVRRGRRRRHAPQRPRPARRPTTPPSLALSSRTHRDARGAHLGLGALVQHSAAHAAGSPCPRGRTRWH